MAASTGSAASRRSTKLTPFTTRPSLTSRQGITRTLNIREPLEIVYLFEHDLFGKPVPTFPDHALSRSPRGTDQRQRGLGIKPAVVERPARDRAGQFFRARRQQRLDVVDRRKAAGGDDG